MLRSRGRARATRQPERLRSEPDAKRLVGFHRLTRIEELPCARRRRLRAHRAAKADTRDRPRVGRKRARSTRSRSHFTRTVRIRRPARIRSPPRSPNVEPLGFARRRDLFAKASAATGVKLAIAGCRRPRRALFRPRRITRTRTVGDGGDRGVELGEGSSSSAFRRSIVRTHVVTHFDGEVLVVRHPRDR